MYITKKQLEELEKVADMAEMNRASFNFNPEHPKDDKLTTEEIKEATRLYRHAWIIAPLRTVINDIKERK